MAMWDIHLAVGLEGDMMGDPIAQKITQHTLASWAACLVSLRLFFISTFEF